VDHVDDRGRVVVVLATYGYFDMLCNFLQSVRRVMKGELRAGEVNDEGDRSVNLPIMILTDDVRIVEVAELFHAGSYLLTTSGYTGLQAPLSVGWTKTEVTDELKHKSGLLDFGTLSYQELILGRTECVMDLLLLGFSPIVADIDTVWLQNPLEVIDQQIHLHLRAASLSNGEQENASEAAADILNYDVLVTDDHGEICGCFVVLKPTSITLHFWSELLIRHQELVRVANIRSSPAGGTSGLLKFSDSEQKILTDMLLFRHYSNIAAIKVFMLSKQLFPSGLAFFNELDGIASLHVKPPPAPLSVVPRPSHRNATASVPAVIHNNFVIGKHFKKLRFERYRLWSALPPLHPRIQHMHHGLSLAVAEADEPVYDNLAISSIIYDPLQAWRLLVDDVGLEPLPSLNFVLPVHDGKIPSKQAMVQVTTEGLSYAAGTGKLWVELDPPSMIEFTVMGVYELMVARENVRPVNTFSSAVVCIGFIDRICRPSALSLLG
jgi:hypothetical protein